MNAISANWKTTILGVGLLLTALGGAISSVTDGDPSTNVELTQLVTEIMAGLALIFARDGDVSSETSKAK